MCFYLDVPERAVRLLGGPDAPITEQGSTDRGPAPHPHPPYHQRTAETLR